MNLKEIALIITLLMTVVGLGGVVLEYYYDVGLTSALHIFSFGAVGVLGLVLSAYIIRENMRNWYWHEVRKEHAIAFLVIVLVIFLTLWYYGWLDWLL